MWLDVSTVSNLLNLTPRAIREKVYNGYLGDENIAFRYVSGIGGNSGRVLEILLESLPDEAQERYHDKRREHKFSAANTLTPDTRIIKDNKVDNIFFIILTFLSNIYFFYHILDSSLLVK